MKIHVAGNPKLANLLSYIISGVHHEWAQSAITLKATCQFIFFNDPCCRSYLILS